MKTSVLVAAVATLMGCVSISWAQTSSEEHAGHHAAASAAPAPNGPLNSSDPVSASAMMSRMQDNMKSMQDLMAKIRSSHQPDERQKLMQEHMRAMREQMDLMRGMGSERPSAGAAATPKAPDAASKDSGMNQSMMMRGQMMQKRMDMMQTMMEQMLQHQEAQEESTTRK